MAVEFSKSSGLNSGLYKDTDVRLTAIIQETEANTTKDDVLVNSLFNVKTSKRYAEKVSSITTFSDFSIVAEGGDSVLDDIQEGYSALIDHRQFIKGFKVTAEMAEDEYLNEAKVAAANFVRAYKRSRANFATTALVTEGATFTYGSKTIDKKTGDAKGLFATDHPSKHDEDTTQSNVFTNEFGSDDVMLNRLANLGRNFLTDSGHVQGYEFDTIIIPGNCPTLERAVRAVVGSELQVGSANNDINISKGRFKLIVNHRWIAASGTEPFMVLSSEANRELLGNVFYDRIPLTVIRDVITKSHGIEYSGRFRASVGFNNWRHIILGGATTGTTLT